MPADGRMDVAFDGPPAVGPAPGGVVTARVGLPDGAPDAEDVPGPAESVDIVAPAPLVSIAAAARSACTALSLDDGFALHAAVSAESRTINDPVVRGMLLHPEDGQP